MKQTKGFVAAFLRKKSMDSLMQTANQSSLKKSLTTFDLTMLGIGAVIGAGIFVTTGTVSYTAGPALILSYVLAGLACIFSALAYAEFASTVPVAGSAYTYTYFTLGEGWAWIIGWDLILEYLLAVSAIASGWSGYFQSLFTNVNIQLPEALSAAPGATPGAVFDVPAFCIVILLTFLLSIGIRESKMINNVMVLVKVAIVLLFVIVGALSIHSTKNWVPFMPHGMGGVFAAAGSAFFAYIGFDAIASASEETKNPRKSMPRAIVLSIIICTVLYVATTLVLTGLVKYTAFTGVNATHPISLAIDATGHNWIAGFIDLGAILGMTTVIMVFLFGLVRIMFSISRDGLLPKVLSKTHPRFHTPFNATWFFGILGGLIAGLVPLSTLTDLISIGTLVAFVIVSISVIVLRRTKPDLKRGFRCPGVPVVPIIGIITCAVLIVTRDSLNFIRFGVWFVIGIIIYFLYARKHSKLATGHANGNTGSGESSEDAPSVSEEP